MLTLTVSLLVVILVVLVVEALEIPDPMPEWVYTDLLLEDLHPEDIEGLES